MSNGPWRHHSQIIPEYARDFPTHRILVETGTGETAENAERMAPFFDLVFTIDVDPETALFAMKKFSDTPNVIPVCADSEDLMEFFVGTLGKPAIFFLDGHNDHNAYQRRGRRDTPVEAELKIILAGPPRHIVLIDDARFFLDQGDRDLAYPSYKWVEEQAKLSAHICTVADDVIRLVPA